ncbi:MAG TPA: lipopolysaccharide kinase InaA family protein [Candidatus Binatia bacterium]
MILRRGPVTLWVDPDVRSSSGFDAIAEPDALLARPDCRIIKDQKKIKVGRLTLDLNGRSLRVYVKRYNAFSARYKAVSLMAKSGALRALEGAAILKGGRIATARPLAAVEIRPHGMLAASFFITEEISGGKTADRYWQDDLSGLKGREGFQRRRGFLRGLAAVFSSLHGQRIYHNDLKDANILVAAADAPRGENFFLLDLEGVRRCSELSQRRRIKNVVQLNRTLGRYLRRPERLYFLRSYLGAGGDEKSKLGWITSILNESRRLDRAKALAI